MHRFTDKSLFVGTVGSSTIRQEPWRCVTHMCIVIGIQSSVLAVEPIWAMNQLQPLSAANQEPLENTILGTPPEPSVYLVHNIYLINVGWMGGWVDHHWKYHDRRVT